MNRQILLNFSIFEILILKISDNPGRINSFDIDRMEDLENIINIILYIIYGFLVRKKKNIYI